MHLKLLTVAALALLAAACGPKGDQLEDLSTRLVTLPDGRQIRAELKISSPEMQRGMMFRDALPPGRGMLFVHERPGPYTYWMFQVKVPLDIIFMDSSRRILGIAANVPPCPGPQEACPQVGGAPTTQYVLELNGGQAAAYGLRQGQILSF